MSERLYQIIADELSEQATDCLKDGQAVEISDDECGVISFTGNPDYRLCEGFPGEFSVEIGSGTVLLAARRLLLSEFLLYTTLSLKVDDLVEMLRDQDWEEPCMKWAGVFEAAAVKLRVIGEGKPNEEEYAARSQAAIDELHRGEITHQEYLKRHQEALASIRRKD